MVAVDALTPGEIKAGGAGIEIRFGFASSPFGEVLVGQTRRGVCHLQFVAKQRERAIADLRGAWPHAAFVRDDDGARALLDTMFTAVRHRRPIPGLLKGTNFQIKVWEALLRVPPGAVVSYGDLASAVGMPSASRAVGTALGKNAIALLIPCHRVIRGDGDTGAYRWGAERKEAILAWEAARVSQSAWR
jgi:AraC family transcriptional regulator of adaptative response/methylated-DNA-[protein]-cysteine methyltransferase